MRTWLIVSALAAAAACAKSDRAQPAEHARVSVPSLSVDEVDAHLAKGECQPVDANGAPTRHKLGVLPGAVLLTDSDDFKLSELPADRAKELVFYCANTQCGASHHAAEKAIAAGYSNVRVMPAGIAGWVKAGKKTQSI